ncbi:MAG: hypothetical protein JOY81_03175 [Alphaproteobacteria bacterium]|nr:hypothetical protein [Alphaproteobacteria bacterium]
MTVVADGNVVRKEVEDFMDAMMAAKVGTYRKLFDARRGTTEMNANDILALGVKARGLHSLVATGPLAIVEPDYDYRRFSPLLGLLAAAERPMKLFRTEAQARAWLGQPEIRRWRGRVKVRPEGPTPDPAQDPIEGPT